MKRLSLVLLILVVAISLITACSQPTPTSTPTPTPSPTSSPTATTTTSPTASPKPTTPEKTWTLKAAWYTPDSDTTRTNMMKWWANELATRTNNRVKVQAYWAGGLIADKDILDSTGAGACDLGDLNGNLFPAKMPLINLLTVPGMGTTSYSMIKIQWDLYVGSQVPEYKTEFTKNNIVQMAPFGYESHQFWTRSEIKTLADLKGQRLRTASHFAKLVEAVGATPVTMSSGDAFLALQKGTLDGLHWAPDTVHKWKIHEVVKYYTKADIGAIGANAIVMNLDKWKEMPADIQQIMLKLAEDLIVKQYQTVVADDARFFADFAKVGLILNSLPPADLAKIKELSIPIQDAVAKDVEAKQGVPAVKFVKAVMDLVPKYDAEAAALIKK